MIKSAGHLTCPCEVESALLEHPALAKTAAIGLSDAILGQRVAALVTRKPDQAANDALRRELLAHARHRRDPAVAPRAITVRDARPKNSSGNILRRPLRERELGLVEKDIVINSASAYSTFPRFATLAPPAARLHACDDNAAGRTPPILVADASPAHVVA
jgi:hypothetical protein